MQGTGVETEVGRIGTAAEPGVGDFIALMKPRVMSLVVFTALTGMVAAPGAIHPVLGVIALLAIAIGAGASGALNMWYDADIDARMARTAARPIPRGHLTRDEALELRHGAVRLLRADAGRAASTGRQARCWRSPSPTTSSSTRCG